MNEYERKFTHNKKYKVNTKIISTKKYQLPIEFDSNLRDNQMVGVKVCRKTKWLGLRFVRELTGQGLGF